MAACPCGRWSLADACTFSAESRVIIACIAKRAIGSAQTKAAAKTRLLRARDKFTSCSAREDVMAMWQPDPSFYPSPRQAANAPPEKPPMWRRSIPSAGGRMPSPSSMSTPPRRPIRKSSAMLRRAFRATNSITSAGMRARPASAPTRPTRIWSGVISSSRACAPRGSTSSTPSPIRAPRRSSR